MPTPKRSRDVNHLIMIRIVILALILCFNSISTAYMDTFLPDMMITFKVAKTKTESGKYAGWLFSAFFFGRFLSASFWGFFIDKYGRKKGLLLILTLLNICITLFGLSRTYMQALLVRFVTGLVNGLSIVGKTLSTEICPDDLKPWSISVTNTIWSLGMTVGPIIGSLVYNVFPNWPMLLSSLAVNATGILLIILSIVYFEETLNFSQVSLPDKPAEYEEVELKARPTPQAQPLHNVDYGTYLGSEILAIPNVIKIIGIFSMNTFYASVLVVLIPFWIASRFEDGGLEFQYHDISDIFLYLMGPQIGLQIILYPFIQKKRGDFWLLTRGHLAHIPVFFLLPYAHFFGKGSLSTQKMWITFWMFVRNLASFMNFAALQRFGNEIISSNKRGKMNGLQITFSSLFQIIGTFLGGWLLTWSETNKLNYPFNYHFIFLLLCIATIIVLRVIYSLKFSDSEKTKIYGEKYYFENV